MRRVTVLIVFAAVGALLAMRHVGEAIAAPIFGSLADRLGPTLGLDEGRAPYRRGHALRRLEPLPGAVEITVGFGRIG